MNFEELDSPNADTLPDQDNNCVDTGPAAKMLIPKADRKAIHEVRPKSRLFFIVKDDFFGRARHRGWEMAKESFN